MQYQEINRFLPIAAIGLYSLGLLNCAIAAPLAVRVVPIASRSDSALPMIDPRVTAAPLDLRVPRDSDVKTFRAETAAIPAGEFASGIQHPVSTIANLSIKENRALSDLIINAADFHVTSPAERFVGRVHREGLPIARLWQSESALLSIGLNRRGKPGVWFTKTIH
jgi:hypothetical protein